jgi:hypothetical protein
VKLGVGGCLAAVEAQGPKPLKPGSENLRKSAQTTPLEINRLGQSPWSIALVNRLLNRLAPGHPYFKFGDR